MNGPAAQPRTDTLAKAARLAGRLTWAVTAGAFVTLLGGLHPGDALRARISAIALWLILGLNAPDVLVLIRDTRQGASSRRLIVRGLQLSIRLLIVLSLLAFAASIRHGSES